MAPVPPMVQRRGCFDCGDPNHFRDACPRRQAAVVLPPGQGRAYMISAPQVQAQPVIVEVQDQPLIAAAPAQPNPNVVI